MHLGKTIIGGLIGAAIGIGLLVGAYFALKLDQMWTAIVVAVCVGLGVRMLVATHGHASYARGAITALIAIAAFVGAKFIVAQAETMRSAASPNTAKILAERRDADDASTDATAPGESAEILEIADRPTPRVSDNGAVGRGIASRDFSTWDFVWVCIAGLVAYELGRGAGTSSLSDRAPTSRTDPNAAATL